MRSVTLLSLKLHRLLFTHLLLASIAFAQPAVTRSGALKKRQYQTYSSLTYYMDPTGSDANSCTSASSPCLTFNGIYSKLPRIIRHSVTVNVAAGNYTFDSRWDGAQWSSANTSGSSGPTVDFVGPPLTNATLTTGTPTGTITSLVTTNPPLPTITDSTQSWTTNELRGRFLVITSGAANTTMAVIVSNTATTITHTPWGSATVPSVGDSYAIQTPAAIITGTQTVANHTGGFSNTGILRYSQMEFTSTGTTLSFYSNGNAFLCQLGATRIRSSGSSTTWVSNRGRVCIASGSSYLQPMMFVENSGSGSALSASEVVGSLSLRGYFRSNATVTASVSGEGAQNQWNRLVAETTSTSTTAEAVRFFGMLFGLGSGLSYNWMYAICPSGGTGTGIHAYNTVSLVSAGPTAVTNCAVGLALGGPLPGAASSAYPTGSVTFSGQSGGGYSSAVYCNGTTTCMKVASGARYTNAAAPTFTGVTNEYDIDGTSYTHSFINGLTPKRVVGVNQSVVELE